MRVTTFLILGAIAGLVVGYFLFASIAGEYVSVGRLLRPSGNVLDQVANSVIGVEQMRLRILISGGIGAVVGAVAGTAIRRG